MAVDPAILDVRQEPLTLTVERGRLQGFAQAIGETRAEYVDAVAARAAGHRDVLVPPTFLMGLELESSDTFAVLADHGADLSAILHGEQRFTYRAEVCAGDTLTFTSRFTDCYAKSGGALEFVVRQTEVRRADEVVAELSSVSIVQNRRSG
jgi:hypothetical protein